MKFFLYFRLKCIELYLKIYERDYSHTARSGMELGDQDMSDHMVTILRGLEFDTRQDIMAHLAGNCFCSLSITRAATVVYSRYRVVWREG